MAKKHKFSHTHVEHHKDGSATVHHVHEEGPHKDIKHAAADMDAVHDSMQEHLGQPNPGENEDAEGEAMEEQIHPGIHAQVAAAQQ